MQDKIRSAIRYLFSPGASAYDESRHIRIVILSIMAGIFLAVAFGFLLYTLNTMGRLH